MRRTGYDGSRTLVLKTFDDMGSKALICCEVKVLQTPWYYRCSNAVTYLEMFPFTVPLECPGPVECVMTTNWFICYSTITLLEPLVARDRGRDSCTPGVLNFPRQFGDLKKLDKLVRTWRRQISAGSEKPFTSSQSRIFSEI